jgi:PAS domain S-box-containing protein
MEENREMDKRMKSFRANIKKVFGEKEPKAGLIKKRDEIRAELLDLLEYEKHCVKKENILFPYIEKYFPDYRCVSVMWSMHDDARESIKTLLENLDRDEPLINVFNMNIGKLYYSVLPVIFREEYILYPIAARAIKKKDWDEMLLQSREEGFSFIEPPQISDVKQGNETEAGSKKSDLIDLGTGVLSAGEIIRIFNHLPVDITFVDENDEVKYFSTPKDRIFGRSKAIIGRKVQNCHPHESVHIVNEIVDSFKSGRKDVESFWISFKDKFLLIQYFAVRDEQGSYKGVIEVSQDVSDIRKLQGEKRLLDM